MSVCVCVEDVPSYALHGDHEYECVCVFMLKMFPAMISVDHEGEYVCVCFLLKMYPAMISCYHEGECVCVCVYVCVC